MSKAFTAYVFYGGAALVLILDSQRRRVLLGAPSLLLHAAAALAPVLWLSSLPATSGQGTRMLSEMLVKLMPRGAFEYLQHLAGYPAETALRLSPAILLVAYFAWRRRIVVGPGIAPHLKTALWITLLGFLPYWLSPHGAIRYLVPIYPLAGFALALLLWSAGDAARRSTRQWLAGMIALKLVAAVILFPYYQHQYRGENYALAARAIIERCGEHPLYTTSDTASGLSVVGYIDARWRQNAPVQWAPANWSTGFVLAEEADPAVGEVAARFKFGGDELFLLCRGAACAGATR
ncbi:MAG: hypothetical protein K8S22_09155 [Betaproteobacteria bacterium]|nr:hypothetical protein [Betaproteobacteria bacterium]